MRIPFRSLALTLTLALFAAGCASGGANLDPAPSANEAPAAEEAVVRNVNGVEMTVQAGAWAGEEGVTQDVTPLQVTLNNGSSDSVAVRYRNFSLIAPDGQRYAALPPFSVQGTVDMRETEPVADPGFTYDGFGVAPSYGGYYSGGVGVYDTYGYSAYDTGYYGTYADYWDNVQLPTREMIARALPEGVVEPGGRVQGFLYFEKVDGDAVPRVRFRADLQDAGGGRTFGEISIPFTVSEDE